MTLIELLIAMTVMSIGIAALVAGFSSGVVAITRATADVDRRLARRQADGASTVRRRHRDCRSHDAASDHAGRPGRSHVLDAESTVPGPARRHVFGGAACQLLRHAGKPSR